MDATYSENMEKELIHAEAHDVLPGTRRIDVPLPGGHIAGLTLPAADALGFDPARYTRPNSEGMHNRRGFDPEKRGKKLADRNWRIVVEALGTSATITDYRSAVDNLTEGITASGAKIQEEYVSALETSFRKRVEYMQRKQDIEEIKATTSPWRPVMNQIVEKVYENNYRGLREQSAAQWILGIKSEAQEDIEHLQPKGDIGVYKATYEQDLAHAMKAKLNQLKPEEIAEIRSGGLNELLYRTLDLNKSETLRDDVSYIVRKLDKETEADKKQALAQVTATDIEQAYNEAAAFETPAEVEEAILSLANTELSKDESPNDLPASSEQVPALRERIRQKLNGIFPKGSPRKALAMMLVGTVLTTTALGTLGFMNSQDAQAAPDNANTPRSGPVISADKELASSVTHDIAAPATPDATLTPPPPPSPNRPGWFDKVSRSVTHIFAQDKQTLPEVKNEQQNPNFQLQGIRLDKDFSITIPSEVIAKGDIRGKTGERIVDNQTYNLDVEAVYGEFITDEQIATLNNYNKFPTYTQVLRTDMPGSNIIQFHDKYTDDGQVLPGEWIRSLYNKHKDANGQINEKIIDGTVFYITQKIDGKETRVPMRAVGFEVIKTPDFIVNQANYPDDNQPVFERTDMLNLPRHEGYQYLLTSYGEHTPQGYNEKLIMTARPLTALEASAQSITETIEKAHEQGLKGGANFTDFIRSELTQRGIPLTKEAESILDRLAGETENRELQCVFADALLGTLPGSDDAVDLYGWRIYDPSSTYADKNGYRGINKASEYLLDLRTGEKRPELNEPNRIVGAGDAVMFRVGSVADFEEGDHFVTGESLAQPEGHIGRILYSGLDDNGEAYAWVFDGNFENDGLPRITKITDNDMNQLLANLPASQKETIVAIRSMEKFEASRNTASQ